MKNKDRIFSYIDSLGAVKLDEDLAESGLTAINEKIAEICNKRSKAGNFANRISKLLYDTKRRLTHKEEIYQLKFDRLMAYDSRIKRCSNKEEMLSTCRSILSKYDRYIRKLKTSIEELETLEKCLKVSLKTLQHAKESIAKQMRVLEHQMEIGEVNRHSFANT